MSNKSRKNKKYFILGIFCLVLLAIGIVATIKIRKKPENRVTVFVDDEQNPNIGLKPIMYSREGAIAEGEQNGLSWYITGTGVLVIYGTGTDGILTSDWQWKEYGLKVKAIYMDCSLPKHCSGMFRDMFGVSNLSFGPNFTSKNMVYADHMFHNCNPCGWNENMSAYWDTSKVEDTSYMFANEGSLNACYENFGLHLWNITSITNMSHMFAGNCSAPNIAKWDISEVNDISYIFEDCAFNNLVFLENWDVAAVENKEKMFAGYSSFYYDGNIADFSKWKESGVDSTHVSLDNVEGVTGFK